VKVEADGARELVDALGGDMMMISNELEKLILYVGEKKRITLGDVETMVLAAKQRSLYELTDAISSKDRVRALEVLDAILTSGDGEEAAIGHIYMLAKTFRQMLVILATSATSACCGRLCGRAFACPRSPPTTSSSRPAAINPAAN
jgi:DNA polymerase-3 subunit delta